MNIYIADSFTNKPYSGNPAGVCILPTQKPDKWMQRIAAEMNASETAFLIKSEDGFSLRWFSPIAEVDLCGHATLASAHILWETKTTEASEIRFHTQSGLLRAKKSGVWIELNFPAERETQAKPPEALSSSLNVAFNYVGKNRMDYIVEVSDQETVLSLQPNFEKLKSLRTRGVIVTARANDEDTDFVSRCFYPGLGINEDWVTGSAHCCLGPYWSLKLGKTEMVAKQLSARQGDIKLSVRDQRVLIYGQAVTTLTGVLSAE